MQTRAAGGDHSVSFTRAVGAEWGSALAASAAVAPAISIIDKSIIANASGRQPLLEGIVAGFKTLFTRPGYFVRQPSFIWIWGVYAGTYITANTIEVACEFSQKPAFYPKFIGSSIANVTLSVTKDRAFTRMFGASVPKPLPLPTYGLFATRDSLTILAGFSLPPLIAKELVTKKMVTDIKSAEVLSQLSVPCLMQICSTPMHLLGLDLYNRPGVSTIDRLNFIRKEYLGTALARMGRIFPAYGIGGVLNKKFRHDSRDYLKQH
jgi:hypothetical protein